MDFANILFGGACNRRCPFCIGQRLPQALQQSNLDLFPLHNLDSFVQAVDREKIGQIVMTGTTTDPQLYRHEIRLLDYLRASLPGRTFSLHSNGVMALRKLDAFNHYDKVCLSFPSFQPATYARMMGSPRVPDLTGILAAARVPVKLSCLVNEDNRAELPSFLERCQALGVERLVLRYLFGETRRWQLIQGEPTRFFRRNPVYQLGQMEVTVWSFDDTSARSLNLFPDGTLSDRYLLTEAHQEQPKVSSKTPA